MPLADSSYFNPMVYKGSTKYFLPKPTPGLIVRNAWDARKSKVPLKDGITSNGQSLNETIFAIQGKVGLKPLTDDVESATTFLTEVQMFDALTTMRGYLDTDDATRFEFFIFYNAASTTYRKFKSCYASSFDFSVGDDVNMLFTYTAEIIAEDPTVYTTAPGA